MRFLRHPGNNVVLLPVALALFCFSGAAPAMAFDANTSAQSLSDAVGVKFGSSEGLTQNAVNPLSSGGSQMTTISGTSTFSASLVFCPSSSMFMDVSVIPGSTGDISSVYIRQDTDFDSTMDYTYSVPVLVSGICGNGVISCDAATWSNCSYYKWIADSAGKVSLEKVNMQDLGGCFCINNSCGSNLVMNQLSYVLSIVGSGVAGAIQAMNPKWTISSSSTADMTTSYYGQNTDQCSAPTTSMSSGTSNPEQYYTQDVGVLDAAGQAEATKQSAVSGSGYSTLLDLSAASSTGGSYYTCSIQNTATVVTTSSSPTYSWEPWLGINVYCWWGRDSINGCTNTIQIDTTDNGIYDLTETQTLGCCFTTWEDVTTHQPIADDIVTLYQQKYSVGSTSIRTQSGSESFSRLDGGGKGATGDTTYYLRTVEKKAPAVCQTDYAYSATDDTCYKDTLATGQSDGCSYLESDANCTLKDEIVDSITTYQNYQSTGLSPLSSCITLTGKLQSFEACSNWWTKNRTYYCKTTSSYDFTNIQDRSANISTTTAAAGSSFSYQDMTTSATGEASYTSHTVSSDTTGATDACMQACETRKSATNTQASLSGTTAQSNVSTSSWEYYYHQCESSGCPVDTASGEEIVKDCQCIDDFANAASIMEAMNDAGKDLICSSGTTTTQ